MVSDDSEVESSVGEEESAPGGEPARERHGSGSELDRSLPEQLSQTVPSRRAYGLERMDGQGARIGLLSPRERQYLHHAHRLDQPEWNAVADVLTDRVDKFVETEWPFIIESYPDIAAALREELCGGEET